MLLGKSVPKVNLPLVRHQCLVLHEDQIKEDLGWLLPRKTPLVHRAERVRLQPRRTKKKRKLRSPQILSGKALSYNYLRNLY